MSTSKLIDEPPYALPATGFVRQKQLETIIPFSRGTLWRKVKEGTFPAPAKISAGVTAWRVEDIRAWMEPIHAQLPPLPTPSTFASTPARVGGPNEMITPARVGSDAMVSGLATAAEKRLDRQLIAEATAWRDAVSLRAYIANLLGAVVVGGGQPSSGLSAWLVRATQAADRLDPTKARLK